MRPPREIYDQIPPLSPDDYKAGFIRYPGIYCINCGDVSALYSYCGAAPAGFDENGKPFLARCIRCRGVAARSVLDDWPDQTTSTSR